jgi:hypothetical protein
VGVSDKMATFWRKNVTEEQIRKVEMAFKETEKTPQVMFHLVIIIFGDLYHFTDTFCKIF